MKRFFLVSWVLFYAVGFSFGHTENEGIFGQDRLKSVLGQDGVTSIPVQFKNGEKGFLWTFGDTILGDWKGPVATTSTLNFSDVADMKAMPCNTLALSDVPDEKNYKNLFFKFYPGTGNPSEFITYKQGENPWVKRMWANDGIQEKDKIYVFYMDIKLKEDKPGDFDFNGTGLAISEIPENPDVSKFVFRRSEKFYAEKMLLGDSVVQKGKYFYILGRLSQKNDGNLNSILLARVKPGNIENLKDYEFLSKKGKWQKKEKSGFFDDITGESSLTWDEYRKIFRIIYMSTNQEIKQVTFSNFKEFVFKPKVSIIYKPDSKKDVFYYSAKEIFHTKNAVYLIYIDPSIYQPILIKHHTSPIFLLQ